MKSSKLLIVGLILILAGVIVWQVGFKNKAISLPDSEQAQAAPPVSEPSTPEPNASEASEPNKGSIEPNITPEPAPDTPSESAPTPPEASKPEPNQPQVEAPNKPAEKPAEPNEPNEPMEALNLKEVQMKDIVKKITEWTNKVVIPTGDAMKQKITIFSPKEVTRPKALSLIYAALRTQGYMAEEDGDVIYLKPIKEAKLGKVPVVGPDEPLAAFENKEQVVQKFFKLKNYNPDDMVKIVQPFIADYGMVTSDATTGTVTAIETITNLMRIGTVINQFDVPEAEQTLSELISIENGDPSEVVQLLRVLLDNSGANTNRRVYSRYNRSTSISTVIQGQGKLPIILIPQPKNKMIIVRASAQDMKAVKEWIGKLDVINPASSEYETISVRYVNASEVARQIEDAIYSMPGSELRPNILVRPLEQSRQIMIFGPEDMRRAVKDLIQEIDMPTGVFETKEFVLKHADAEQIKENIDNLYGEEGPPEYDTYYYYRYGPGSRAQGAETVKAIAFPWANQVTVISSPENMRKIEKQVEEWDQPLDVNQVKPRIITLHNSDPVQMAQLLSKLFSEEDDMSSQLIRYIYNGDMDSKKKIIGPLYGQLTFESVPGSKKIIVISKVPQAYDVIADLIAELDGQEMAEVPEVIPLKYADPESLAERLNALFNESGTNANIRFQDRTLGESVQPDSQNRNQNNNGNRDQNRQEQTSTYSPWWNDQGRRQDEEPISNVIGKVRFIPDTHSKSLLVLAAPEFMESIKQTVHKLDIPGKQVLIKAIVIEVDHSSMTSLGVQLSTNPDAFGGLGENSVRALSQLTHMATHGSGVNSSSTADVTADIYGLIDFLAKTVNAKILNQQSLWTKDNERANFFKGDIVPFTAGSSVGSTDRVTSDIVFEDVGMTMEVRPSITPEEKVDMLIHVNLSQLTDDIVNGQPVRGSMDTSTKMIVESGETLMLAGILFQKDSLIHRKVPLLGDVPLVGALFRHKEKTLTNNELIVFIIPEVIDDGQDMKDATSEIMQEPIKKLDHVKQNMNQRLSESGVIKQN